VILMNNSRDYSCDGALTVEFPTCRPMSYIISGARTPRMPIRPYPSPIPPYPLPSDPLIRPNRPFGRRETGRASLYTAQMNESGKKALKNQLRSQRQTSPISHRPIEHAIA
jgi:hypothetical protein